MNGGVVTVHPGQRQAALLLHGTSPVDRQWLLEQLDDSQKKVLETLLGELEALGIPASPTFEQEMIVASGEASISPAPMVAANSLADLAARFRDIPRQVITDRLRSEPDALRLRALALREGVPSNSGSRLDRLLMHALLRGGDKAASAGGIGARAVRYASSLRHLAQASWRRRLLRSKS